MSEDDKEIEQERFEELHPIPLDQELIKEIRLLATKKGLPTIFLRKLGHSAFNSTLKEAALKNIKSGGYETAFWVLRDTKDNSVQVSEVYESKKASRVDYTEAEELAILHSVEEDIWPLLNRKIYYDEQKRPRSYPVMMIHFHPLLHPLSLGYSPAEKILPSTYDVEYSFDIATYLNPFFINGVAIINDEPHARLQGRLLLYQLDPDKIAVPQIIQTIEEGPVSINALEAAGFRVAVVDFERGGKLLKPWWKKFKEFAVAK
jgi:hypothetical protein